MRKVPTDSYELHFAISDDIASGWIWVQTSKKGLLDQLNARRPVARVSCNGAAVYCEVLSADPFDLRRFDEFYTKHRLPLVSPSPLGPNVERVFINHWYRNKLGIGNDKPPGSALQISFKFKNTLMGEAWYQACACMDHPQVIVRVATWAGLVALGLGVLGCGLALLPLADDHAFLNACVAASTRAVGAVLCVGGLIEIVLSTLLFAKSRR